MYKDRIEVLSKKITGIDMKWDDIKKLDNQQQKILFEQMQRFAVLKNSKVTKTEYKVNEDGKLLLQEGTLLHGVRGWTAEILEEISKTGIVSCEFGKGVVEDNETFYSADFWRVDENASLGEYTEACIRNKKPEADFLPLRRFDKTNKIAFIIDSNNYSIQELLSYDAFRDNGTPSEISESIISQNHRSNREYMKERLSAVLFGIPSNAFSGIMIGKKLSEEMPEKIEEIKKIFPELYIVTQEGNLIYEPNKEKKQELPIAEDPKKSMKTISSEITGQSVGEASSEIKNNYNDLTNHVKEDTKEL